MHKGRSTSVLPLIMLSLILCLSPSGCGRSAGRTAVKRAVSPPRAAMAGSLEVAKQDLSMAKKLQKRTFSEYILGPEDTVVIRVFRHNELKMEATISSTGKISHFLIGDIQAAGLTQFQLRDEIENELAKFIKEPKVVVSIAEYRSHKVFVLGQVKKPGVYRMRNHFTLVEAISAAGGIGSDAYLSGAYVVRDGKILLVNFLELIEKGNTEENIPLLAEDVVYVPDSKDQKVFVLGEVNKQAAIPIRERMTLLEAVAEAGGFTRDGKKGSVVVMRGNLSKPEVMRIDAERVDALANISLQRGDIVYVASSGFANAERIAVRLSHILEPFYKLARTVIWGDAAIEVLKGAETKLVIVD